MHKSDKVTSSILLDITLPRQGAGICFDLVLFQVSQQFESEKYRREDLLSQLSQQMKHLKNFGSSPVVIDYPRKL